SCWCSVRYSAPHSFPPRRSSDRGMNDDDAVAGHALARERTQPRGDIVGELQPRRIATQLRGGRELVDVLPAGTRGPDEADLQIRSEEHTSELQSRENLVCRLLLE